MDDIMILMHRVVIDLQGFNESQFGIFGDDEQEQLNILWKTVHQDPNKFISMLSSEQKQRLALWASERTSYSVDEIIVALEKFTKFLKSASYANHQTYPKPPKKKDVGNRKKSMVFKAS